MDPLPSQTRKNAHILFQSVMKSKWKEVVEMYDDEEVHKAKITKLGATALHVAVSEGDKDTVEKLVAAICRRDKEALKIQNDKGNTALHIAASVGHKESCKFMLDADPSLAGVRNKEGETPLFTAALRGKKDVFLYLNLFCISDSEYDYRNRNNGDNVLHVAIDREYFDLAYQIIHLYNNDKDFLTRENDEGVTPFKVLATKSSAFKSGTNLGRWKRLIYKCIFVNIDDKLIETKPLNPQSEESKNNGRTRHVEYTKSIKTQEEDSMTDIENHSAGPTGCQSTTPSSNEKRNIFLFKKVIPKVTLDILGQASNKINITFLRELRELKQKHNLAVKIMNKLLENYSSYEDTVTFAMEERELQTDRGIHFEDQHGKENDKKADGSTILVATKNGVIEIVDKMLHYFPVAIEDRNVDKKNILLLAAENRHASIYKLLIKKNMLRESIISKVDVNNNSVLHIAADYAAHKPWPIPGVALQMQWEIKWFQFVRSSIPPRIAINRNKYGKTPEEVFTETHKELLEHGSSWLIKTSESCSVVAALIAGVAFASSSSIPGGTIDDSGKPIFENHPAFQVFTIASLLALCFSVTSLVMFLAIITSRFQEKDFNKDLPLKLLIGLTSLFVAIGAMLICFCSGHFLMIEDKLRYAAFPVYAMTCLPVSIFAAAQFPLYLDLFWTTFMNPFDYLHRYK